MHIIKQIMVLHCITHILESAKYFWYNIDQNINPIQVERELAISIADLLLLSVQNVLIRGNIRVLTVRKNSLGSLNDK